MPYLSIHQYVEECCKEWAEDQPNSGADKDEVFWDMAQTFLDNGTWRDEGYTAAEARAFAKAYGMRFGT